MQQEHLKIQVSNVRCSEQKRSPCHMSEYRLISTKSPLTLMILSHILWIKGTIHYDITSSHLDDIITYTMDDEYYLTTMISPPT
jgi:agmatine/peptidylarginine deiminase